MYQKKSQSVRRECDLLIIKSIRPKNFGVIVRTVTENKSVSELDKDLQSLTVYEEGVKKIKKAKVGEDNW